MSTKESGKDGKDSLAASKGLAAVRSITEAIIEEGRGAKPKPKPKPKDYVAANIRSMKNIDASIKKKRAEEQTESIAQKTLPVQQAGPSTRGLSRESKTKKRVSFSIPSTKAEDALTESSLDNPESGKDRKDSLAASKGRAAIRSITEAIIEEGRGPKPKPKCKPKNYVAANIKSVKSVDASIKKKRAEEQTENVAQKTLPVQQAGPSTRGLSRENKTKKQVSFSIPSTKAEDALAGSSLDNPESGKGRKRKSNAYKSSAAVRDIMEDIIKEGRGPKPKPKPKPKNYVALNIRSIKNVDARIKQRRAEKQAEAQKALPVKQAGPLIRGLSRKSKTKKQVPVSFTSTKAEDALTKAGLYKLAGPSTRGLSRENKTKKRVSFSIPSTKAEDALTEARLDNPAGPLIRGLSRESETQMQVSDSSTSTKAEDALTKSSLDNPSTSSYAK